MRETLEAFTAAQQIRAGCILTCVGSLTHAALRLANRDETTMYDGPFEIVSLVGTLSPDGPHLHMALADGNGTMIGGHVQMGSRIYTTAEIVIGVLDSVIFSRPIDPETTYDELVVTAVDGRGD